MVTASKDITNCWANLNGALREVNNCRALTSRRNMRRSKKSRARRPPNANARPTTPLKGPVSQEAMSTCYEGFYEV